MPPVLSIVGKSESGKTTLLEKLIREFVRRGLRVGAVKHDSHGFEIDHEGKDSWRLTQAGAQAVLISSPMKFAMVRQVDSEWSIDALVDQMGSGFDLILTEGYKGASRAKIEVLRSARSKELICSEDELIAVASDLPLDITVPTLHIDDTDAIADFIEERMLPARLFQQQAIAVTETDGLS